MYTAVKRIGRVFPPSASEGMGTDHILPSKRPPPIFADPMVCVYMRYTYKWLVCVSAHPPGVLVVNSKCPWALTRENMVHAFVDML